MWDAGDTAGGVALTKKEKNPPFFEIVDELILHKQQKIECKKNIIRPKKTVNPFFEILFLTSDFLSGRQ